MNRKSPLGLFNRRPGLTNNDARDSVRYSLLIALLIASVVLIGGAIVIIVIALSSAPSFNGVGLDMPYSAQSRPLPDPKNINVDLPGSVAGFTRSAVTGSLNGITGRLSAVYKNGSASIQIELDLNANVAQAQANFKRQLLSIPRTSNDTSQTGNAAYALYEDPNSHAVRFFYTKQYWLLDLTASNREALDSFMAAFPY